ETTNAACKRQEFYTDLHLQEDIAVKEMIASLTTLKPKGKIDRLFICVDDKFDTQNLKLVVQNWIDSAHYLKELHKQDLLYYNIMDFTTSVNSNGAHEVFKDKYSLIKHYYGSRQNGTNEVFQAKCGDIKKSC
ncbi:hypothetical protein CU098_005817, partial [Rhizopus stolonifer]